MADVLMPLNHCDSEPEYLTNHEATIFYKGRRWLLADLCGDFAVLVCPWYGHDELAPVEECEVSIYEF